MTGNWNLVGHEWAVEMLKKHVSHGTTRHAYLFTGPPGLGRRTLALRFAQALNSPVLSSPDSQPLANESVICPAKKYPDLYLPVGKFPGTEWCLGRHCGAQPGIPFEV